MSNTPPAAIPNDYDTNPDRFRTNVLAVEKYGLANDVHEEVAQRFSVESQSPVLDVGCGEGRLTKHLQALGIPTVAFDFSPTMLSAITLTNAASARVQGDACHLPFADNTFGAAAALYMLYHLPDPSQAIAECRRVLRTGGLFAACAPSRYNDPELRPYLPISDVIHMAETFDAENGPDFVADIFGDIEVERWDAPLVHLPDDVALRHYLQGRQLSVDVIDAIVAQVPLPLNLTKRGALIYARK
ncbi:MAG: class I SAM-dependent methyltransferase [Chloroflexota bacterium]